MVYQASNTIDSHKEGLSTVPWLMLCFAFFVSPLANSDVVFLAFYSLKFLFFSIISCLCAIYLCVYWIIHPTRSVPDICLFNCLVVVLLGFAALSLTFGHTAYFGAGELIKLFPVFGLYLVVSSGVISSNRLCVIGGLCFLAAIINATVMLLQYWVNLDTFGQGAVPGGLFGNRNNSSQFLVYSLPFGLLIFFRLKAKAVILAAGVPIGILFAAILAAYTRSAMIAVGLTFCIIGAVAVLLIRKKGFSIISQSHFWGLGIAILTALILTLIPPHKEVTSAIQGITSKARDVSGIITTGEAKTSSSIGDRVQTLKNSIAAFIDQPLGRGLGNWAAIYPNYMHHSGTAEKVTIEIYDFYAHNYYIEKLVELGFFGAVLGVLVFFAFFRILLKTILKKNISEELKLEIVCVCSSAVSILFTASVSMTLNYAVGPFVLALCVGWIVAIYKQSGVSASQYFSFKHEVIIRRVVSGILIIVFAATIMALLKQAKTDMLFAKCHKAFLAGDFENSLKHANATLEYDPYHYRANTRAHVILKRSDPESAHWYVKTVESIYPMIPNNLGLLAYSYTAKNELDKALEYWEKLLDVIPNHEIALREATGITASLKDYNASAEYLKKLVKIAPDNKEYQQSLSNVEALMESQN